MLRIGLLTSGGDCQALNATMRGIVKTLVTNSEEPIEIYGFEDGYQGLIYSRFRVMTPADPHPRRHHPGHEPHTVQASGYPRGRWRREGAGNGPHLS